MPALLRPFFLTFLFLGFAQAALAANQLCIERIDVTPAEVVICVPMPQQCQANLQECRDALVGDPVFPPDWKIRVTAVPNLGEEQ